MGIKTDIWMPLYIGEYLADTAHLSTEQSGAYLHLLMHYWRTGPLPNDDLALAQITKLSQSAWSTAQALLKSFFKLGDDGYLHQKRCDQELGHWNDKKLKAKEKASKGGIALKKIREQKSASSTLQAVLNPVLNECPSPSPISSPSVKVPFSQERFVVSKEKDSLEQNVRGVIDRTFRFYCDALGKNPNQYSLTDTRRQKAASRIRERLVVHNQDLGQVEREIELCIQHLNESDFHREQKHFDWVEQIFRSAEEFEKRLTWQKPAYGGNGNGNGYHPTTHSQRVKSEVEASSYLAGLEPAPAVDSGVFEPSPGVKPEPLRGAIGPFGRRLERLAAGAVPNGHR